uniref:Ig-like domain-containing protein n=1 Tax=Neogobius melanostomus TaxID=47308 RepID=A0A8C6WXF5_9GOBI
MLNYSVVICCYNCLPLIRCPKWLSGAKINKITYMWNVNITGQVRVIGVKQPITARVGDDVTLPCRCEPAVDLTPLTVEWWQVELKTHPSRYLATTVYVYTKHGGEMVNRKSPKRTEMFPDQLRTGNASLTLRHVSLSDNGKYTCVIPDLKTEESLRSAQVTLTVQPSDENTSTKNPGKPPHQLGVWTLLTISFCVYCPFDTRGKNDPALMLKLDN